MGTATPTKYTAAALLILLVMIAAASGPWKQYRVRIKVERILNSATNNDSFSPRLPGVFPAEIVSAVMIGNVVLSSGATNELNSIGPAVVPLVLNWSSGKKPAWHPLVNRVLTWLGQPGLSGDIWVPRAKAVKVAQTVPEEAKKGVPILLARLSDPDPIVRRFAIEMLAAIGPRIGTNAFHQMTNMLADSHRHVRNQVIWALQHYDGGGYPTEILIPVYLAGLRDSYRLAQENASAGLRKLANRGEEARIAVTNSLDETGLRIQF